MNNQDSDFFNEVSFLEKSKKDFSTVTLVNIKGSAPQELGAKMIVGKNGELLFGTIGGGKVESFLLQYIKNGNVLDKKFETWNLQKDIGMTCGGEVSFFIESFCFSKAWNLFIFGAGHVVQALTPLLLKLDCYVHVIDERKQWLDKLPTNESLTKHHVSEYKEGVPLVTKGAFVLCITKGHSFDVPVLNEIFRLQDISYIGAIGSKSKRAVMVKELKAMGLNSAELDLLHCPIGENIGNNTPIEISFSIIAELLKYRDQL